MDQPTSFVAIDDGGDLGNNGHDLALDADGNVYCWGNNEYGECGLGTTSNVMTPTEVPGLPAIAQIRAGGLYSLFLSDSGDVWAAGDNKSHQIGNGSVDNQLTPEQILSGIAHISAGASHALAVTS